MNRLLGPLCGPGRTALLVLFGAAIVGILPALRITKISVIVLLLSATGIHALMSFTVARRTREIGIRVALGARPGRIVAGIFSRAFLQISAGLVVGSGLAAVWGLGSTRQVLLLLAADGIMLIVGLAACALPVRRALTIDPTEALRAEG